MNQDQRALTETIIKDPDRYFSYNISNPIVDLVANSKLNFKTQSRLLAGGGTPKWSHKETFDIGIAIMEKVEMFLAIFLKDRKELSDKYTKLKSIRQEKPGMAEEKELEESGTLIEYKNEISKLKEGKTFLETAVAKSQQSAAEALIRYNNTIFHRNVFDVCFFLCMCVGGYIIYASKK